MVPKTPWALERGTPSHCFPCLMPQVPFQDNLTSDGSAWLERKTKSQMPRCSAHALPALYKLSWAQFLEPSTPSFDLWSIVELKHPLSKESVAVADKKNSSNIIYHNIVRHKGSLIYCCDNKTQQIRRGLLASGRVEAQTVEWDPNNALSYKYLVSQSLRGDLSPPLPLPRALARKGVGKLEGGRNPKNGQMQLGISSWGLKASQDIPT